MPVAVTFRLDRVAAEQVDRLSRLLAERGISRYRDRLGYPPHVTLVRCEDLDRDPVLQVVQRVAAQLAPHPIRLEALSCFPDDRSVLWLAPAFDAELRMLQQRIYTDLAPFLFEPMHSEPKSWVPHVTLAAGLSVGEALAAITLLSPELQPIAGILDRIELVRFPPVEVEWTAVVVASS
jgi:2'-5' RNA ligase